MRVTFLGSDRNWVEPGVDGGAYARRRAAAWYPDDQSGGGGGGGGTRTGSGAGSTPLGAPAEVVTGLDTAGALDYLLARGAGRVAVLPSLVENSPLSILELLGAGVPFLASTAGGIPELIHPDDQPGVLFPPDTGALVGKLREALVAGVPRARPARDLGEVERRWMSWHAAHAGFGDDVLENSAEEEDTRRRLRRVSQEETAETGVADVAATASTTTTTMTGGVMEAASPSSAATDEIAAEKVTVIVAARDATGGALRMTLLSALAMSPPPAAVVVAVTSSAGELHAIPAALAAAIPPAHLHRVRWTTAPGATLADARNAAAAAAAAAAADGKAGRGGGPLLIADAGTFLEPHAGAALAAALSTAAADVVTSLLHFYGPGDSMPRDGADRHSLSEKQRRFHVFLGPALSVGAFRNCFGGSVYMLRTAETLLLPQQQQHGVEVTVRGDKVEENNRNDNDGDGEGEGEGSQPGAREVVRTQVGGWSGELAEGYEHWEWLARAALAGARVELFPEAVAWSPPTPGSHRTSRVDHAAAAAVKPLLARLPDDQQRAAVAAARSLGDVANITPYRKPSPRAD